MSALTYSTMYLFFLSSIVRPINLKLLLCKYHVQLRFINPLLGILFSFLLFLLRVQHNRRRVEADVKGIVEKRKRNERRARKRKRQRRHLQKDCL